MQAGLSTRVANSWTLKSILAASLIVGGAVAVSPAGAIVINDPAAGDALPNGAEFSSVVNLVTGGGSQWCTGSMISSTAILTAQHCLAGISGGSVQLTTGSGAVLETMAISGTFTMPGDSNSSNFLDGTDIAVVTIASPFATPLTAMRMLDSMSIVGHSATLVGYGWFGVGSAGPTVNDAKRRGAQNVIDHYGEALDLIPTGNCALPNPAVVTSYQTANVFSADFDNPAGTSNSFCGSNVGSASTMLPEEGTTAPGDSGGPLLVYDATLDEYLIAGVLAGGNSNISIYEVISWWTAIAATDVGADHYNPRLFLDEFGDFVTAIAEPQMIALFALTLVGMAGCRLRAFDGRRSQAKASPG
jgi:secreted trypsin-like serine protease